jgi:hypothetical protein
LKYDQNHKNSLDFLFEIINSGSIVFYAAGFSVGLFYRKFRILFSGYAAGISFFNL